MFEAWSQISIYVVIIIPQNQFLNLNNTIIQILLLIVMRLDNSLPPNQFSNLNSTYSAIKCDVARSQISNLNNPNALLHSTWSLYEHFLNLNSQNVLSPLFVNWQRLGLKSKNMHVNPLALKSPFSHSGETHRQWPPLVWVKFVLL